jgi:hypothetical protein
MWKAGGDMKRNEAKRILNEIFTTWKTLQEDETIHFMDAHRALREKLPTMFEDMIAILRAAESEDGQVDLRVDTALRIALISQRMYQMHPVGDHVEGVARVHSQIQFALAGYINRSRPVHSIERLGLKASATYINLENRVVSEGLTTVRALVTFLEEGGRFRGLRDKHTERIIRAANLYLSRTPNPLVTLPLESEMDLPDEIEDVDDPLPLPYQKTDERQAEYETRQK